MILRINLIISSTHWYLLLSLRTHELRLAVTIQDLKVRMAWILPGPVIRNVTGLLIKHVVCLLQIGHLIYFISI